MVAICNRILSVDKRIGFAMVVDERGEIAESLMRGTRLMSDQDIATYTGLWTALIQGIAKQMEKFLGLHRFYSLGYDKLTVFGLPVGNKTIVITARKDLPLATVLSLKSVAEAYPQCSTRYSACSGVMGQKSGGTKDGL